MANENPIPAYATIVVRSTATTGEVIYEAWHPKSTVVWARAPRRRKLRLIWPKRPPWCSGICSDVIAPSRSHSSCAGRPRRWSKTASKKGAWLARFSFPTLAPAVAGTMR